MIVGILAVADGVIAADRGTTPQRHGTGAGQVRYAYFSTAFLRTGNVSDDDMPLAHTEFEIGKDKQVVFVGAINNPHRNFVQRIVLKRPNGTIHTTARKEFTATTRFNWFYWAREFPIDELRAYPGRWSVDYFVDDQNLGTYSFLLGDVAMLARLREQREGRPGLPSPATPPRAERPTYAVGEKWYRNDGVYELVRIENDRYVFEAPSGVQVRLTRDLTIAAVRKEPLLSAHLEFDPPPRLAWPLEVGASGVSEVTVRSSYASWRADASVSWKVEAYEDVVTAAGRFKAFKVSFTLGPTQQGFGRPSQRAPVSEYWRFAVWYSPEVRQLVKLDGTAPPLLNFEVVALDRPGATPPAVAATPTPSPPSPPPAAPAPRVPPAIALLEPVSGTPIHSDEVTLRIEVKSPHRLTVLRIVRMEAGRTVPVQGFFPRRVAGEPWVVEMRLPLNEGDNVIMIEASDEQGATAIERVTLTRQSLVALELRGPPGARVRVNQDQHALTPQGTLTLELPPGAYRVEASKEGFKPSRETVTLAPGQTRVTHALALTPSPPPTIALVGPRTDVPLHADKVRLSVRVTSPERLASLRIAKGDDILGTFTPAAGARAGEPWLVEAEVSLAEGVNRLTLGAADEHGARTEQTVTLTRQSLIALELRGPPGAEVKVNQDRYTLGSEGTLGLQLPPGSYQVEGSREGYRPTRETLTLAPGQGKAEHRLGMAPVPPPRAALPPADTEAPRIAINYPPAEARIEREQIVITGLVTDNTEVARVQIMVNGVEAGQPRDISVTGAKAFPIRAPAALQPGENVIEVTATDRAGNGAQVVRIVTRVVPAPQAPPVIARERWAVVVGVGRYESPRIPGLRYTVPDAEAIYQVLTGPAGFKKENVLLLTDKTERRPTLRNIKYALGTFLARSAKKDDTVVIFFAGHGAPEVDLRGIERDGLAKYLVPQDADPDDLYATALPMEELQTVFSRIEAERMVVFLDACYSGAAGGRTFSAGRTRATDLDDLFLERLTRAKGRAVITASRPAEVSIELTELGHGVFTYYLVEGLRGAADLNRDGIVSLQELYEYLEQQVTRKARSVGGNQHPVMKGELEGVLPLVKVGR
ncbi:MAG: caspase family protein [Candidatus Rokubacteria bacterium]|nr:caspase family protein [Candidatus Rokubacteria bacterium]